MPDIWKDYWSWRWWARWFVPLPVLLKYSRKRMGSNHVWWQGKDCQLEMVTRFKNTSFPSHIKRISAEDSFI